MLFFLSLLVVGVFSISTPSQAAVKISNGVPCAKEGVVSKTKSGTYRCALNPTTTSKKTTWLSLDCISTGKIYVESKAKLPLITVSAEKTISELDAEILTQQKELTSIRADIEIYKSKIISINLKLSPLEADTANLVKNGATIKAYKSAVKNYERALETKTRATSPTGAITRSISRIENSRKQALSAVAGAQADVASGLEMTKLICTKGF